MTAAAEGLFGPGIFGTGIDLSALDEQTAFRLGGFIGEQIAAAEARGYARAVAALDSQAIIDVLVAHQRMDIRGCLCGWARLGHSHPAHVLGEIVLVVRGVAS